MRLLHTSDWHLGHRLHGVSRDGEHAAFLAWLVDRCVSEQADALIVSGDVFDSANPSAEAQRAYYQFLATCLKECPAMTIVVIGGNHDSPARLDAAAAVLRPLRIHVLGGLPRDAEGAVDSAAAIVPLRDGSGAIAAWLACVPYLRPTDWPALSVSNELIASEPLEPTSSTAPASRILDGLRGLYQQVFAAARARQQPDHCLVAAGHCLVAAGAASEASERRIQLGNSLPLPVEIFPKDFAYIALGHLHRAQRIQRSPFEVAPSKDRGHIRYAGSPIPLAFSERAYPHQIVLVELAGEALAEVRSLPVPRTREVLSLPEAARPIAEVLAILRQLGRERASADIDEAGYPLLEVRVRLDAGTPPPLLRPLIAEALEGARVRLLRIACERPPWWRTSRRRRSRRRRLSTCIPKEVFVRLYQRARGDPQAVVPAAQLALFRQLVEQIEGSTPRREQWAGTSLEAPR